MSRVEIHGLAGPGNTHLSRLPFVWFPCFAKSNLVNDSDAGLGGSRGYQVLKLALQAILLRSPRPFCDRAERPSGLCGLSQGQNNGEALSDPSVRL